MPVHLTERQEMEIKKLEKAHFAAAKIVEKLGSTYLVFFERIHQELMEVEKKQDLNILALNVAKASSH